ncbi:MAG: ATP-binding protein, partial [Burkholderiaceae bacterium]
MIGVAYSGGADSTALLLAAKALWGERVVALHVNHGLQAAAQAFE